MGGYELYIFLGLIILLFIFMSNRSRKQQREAQSFRDSLEIGQEVMTGSGMFGVVADIDGDVITLESPSGDQTRWLRQAIAKQGEPPVAVADEDDIDGIADDSEYPQIEDSRPEDTK